MRSLKLVIWDLDQTIVTGILEEGDEEKNPIAGKVIQRLDERGMLQALATQNSPSIVRPALDKLGWKNLFVQVEADLGPKLKKLKRILDALEVNVLDTAFVDEDPFERDSIAAQIPYITTWSIADLVAYLDGVSAVWTEEARRRSQIYRQQLTRTHDEKAASDYTEFLRSCNIQITIRPYQPEDAGRAEELLTRTHRMNLGVLPVDEAIARLNRLDEHHVVVGEIQDTYGDMGRCGLIHLTPANDGEAVIESLAISCRTRAKGLSLTMLAGLLRHPHSRFQQYRCRYIFNGSNRPLRMLLLGVGFKPQPHTDELVLNADRLRAIQLPDWAHLDYVAGKRELIK
jgi:FkbH-like protein